MYCKKHTGRRSYKKTIRDNKQQYLIKTHESYFHKKNSLNLMVNQEELYRTKYCTLLYEYNSQHK